MAKEKTSIDISNICSPERVKIFRIILFIAFSAILIQLIYLQIIRGSIYRAESETQAIKKVTLEPFRGNLYDRNGQLIVHSEPSYILKITPSDFSQACLPLLTSILGIDSSLIYEKLKKFEKFSKFVPVKILRDLEYNKVILLEEYSDFLPGVEVSVESKRLYKFDSLTRMTHILGFTKEVSDMDLKNQDYYQPGDMIGKEGLESAYEMYLRGEKGVKFVGVNPFGKIISDFDGGKKDIPTRNGSDLFLSLDFKLQKKAERLLAGKRGAIVALDPNNGEILAYVSKPDYDIRLFSGKITQKTYDSVKDHPGKPLINRPISSPYQPGSTWKMLVALAGLQEGIITENSVYSCGGSYPLGEKVFKCHGAHGNLDVVRAIQYSCNVFFYKLARELGTARLNKYAQLFGFGGKTKIDIPGERSYRLPKEDIPLGSLVQYGIGQANLVVTPIQMAVYVATIASKGIRYVPHFVRAYYNTITRTIDTFRFEPIKLPIDSKYFDLVQKGMFNVVNLPGGTGYGIKMSDIQICGKTGTAQNPHGQDHSWFICFAPYDKPQIAVVVIVENAGWGATVAAPIARELLFYYFHPDAEYMPIPGLSQPKPDSLRIETEQPDPFD